jgi:integral membrane protein (TIGR01906 family)
VDVTARRLALWAETAVAALLWSALVLGSAVMTLTTPVYTSALTQALDIPASAGLSATDAVRLSGQVRALVADAEFDSLPATWKGTPAFDAAAVSHLRDVRRVFSGARLATGLSALLLAVYVGWCVAVRRFRELARGMVAGAIVLAAGIALALAGAFTSFDALFAAFHGLFFTAGTWTFPADSLLIRLFPERFWEVSGAAWAGLSLIGAGVLALAARLLRFSAVRLDASRTANNV